MNTNIIAYFKEIKKKPEGSFLFRPHKGGVLFQIIGKADCLAQGVGTGFDRRSFSVFHLSGQHSYVAVSAAVGRAASGNIDFLYGTELVAGGSGCSLSGTLTVVDGFFNQIVFDLIGMFVGETNVIDLVGTEAAGFADDLRNQAEIADFDGQAVGYRIGGDLRAFYVIVSDM